MWRVFSGRQDTVAPGGRGRGLKHGATGGAGMWLVFSEGQDRALSSNVATPRGRIGGCRATP